MNLSPQSAESIAVATKASIRPVLPDLCNVILTGPGGRRRQLHTDDGHTALFPHPSAARAYLARLNPDLIVEVEE